MRYHSTRGGSEDQSFEDVVMRGLAPDGGLYVPVSIPEVSRETLDKWCNLNFTDLAVEILSLYTGDEIPTTELRRMAKASYEDAFTHELTTPLVELSDDIFMLELHHGPTYAFKDVALQFLGNLFEFFLERRLQKGEDVKPITVLGATSGDTGSAAIYGLRGKKNIDVFILHPRGRVAPVQERQMTTVLDENVHNVAVEGTFDDCQNLVKACFNDAAVNDRFELAAINSINWARILAQIVYYFHAYGQYRRMRKLEGQYPQVVFSVPTGNFGDILAGYYAKRMGVPVETLIIATNANDIVHRFLQTGRMTQRDVTPTIAPAMDIQISSNFERYLFYLCGENSDKLRGLMDTAKRTGDMAVDSPMLSQARKDFSSFAAQEDTILSTIRKYKKLHDYVLCPHTACGVAAAEWYEREHPAPVGIISLATAHPAKFDEAVRTAIHEDPPSPQALLDLLSLPTRCLTALNEKAAIVEIISEHSSRARHQDGTQCASR